MQIQVMATTSNFPIPFFCIHLIPFDINIDGHWAVQQLNE